MKLIGLALLAPLVATFLHEPSRDFIGRSDPVSYSDYHVYAITPSSVQHARDLQKRFARFHTHSIRNSLSIVIPPEEIANFNCLGLNVRLVNSNLGKYILDTDKPSTYKRALHERGELPDLSWFDTYHDYADHLQYWDDLVHAFGKNSKKFDIGLSYENRSIYAYHFWGNENYGNGSKRGRKKYKPVILWHATVHAREWISTMVSGDDEPDLFQPEYPDRSMKRV